MKKVGQNIKSTIRSAFTPVESFIHMEISSGLVLLLSTVVALIAANSPLAPWYEQLRQTPVQLGFGALQLNKTLLLLVNDGLMAIFFYLVGLEIKHEILDGELSSPQKASFSIFAAIGGMLFPALIFTALNFGSPQAHAWGVPMATDIAFAMGVLALLGKSVPTPLKIFLLALAIVDDLGAIIVIALFYSSEISTMYLGYASLAMFILFLFNYSGLRNIFWGISLGVISWFFFLKSGVHATLAGVILAFLTPTHPVDENRELIPSKSMLKDYIHSIHPWSAFVIMPIFAFFNAGVVLKGFDLQALFSEPLSLGIILGLLLGNPLGIFSLTYLASALKVAELPKGVTWMQVLSVSCLAGIGFTMSLFIGGLAFVEPDVLNTAKLSILIGSVLSAALGLTLLLWQFKVKKQPQAS